ncbi:MAG: acyltransferase [Clostridiales bacterium]|nr:acyltransferase [Clostridiales bacterium]
MFVLLLLIPFIIGCRPVGDGAEVFGVVTTKSLKGLFASGVVLHHLCTYFCPPITSLEVYRNLGFIMVSGFFLISGYGLTYSARKKEGYLNHFLLRRVLPIIVGFYLSAFAYCLMYRHYHVLTWEMFRTIVTGANYWFIYAILILYIGFYISFRFFKSQNAPYACTVWTVLYMAVMFVKGLKAPGVYGYWWFNSCLAFAAGIWFCVYRDRILGFLDRGYIWKLVLSAAVFGAAFAGVYLIEDKASLKILACELIASVSFCVLVLQFCMRFKVNNIVLKSLGTVSLELYLVQALWIYVVGNEYTSQWHAVLMVFNIIIRTVLLAWVVHYVSKGIMWIVEKVRFLIWK